MSGGGTRCPLRVAVIMGGQSAERDVSLSTGRTIITELLSGCGGRASGDGGSRLRHRVKPVEILAGGLWRARPGFVGEEIPGDPASWFAGDGRPSIDVLSSIIADGVDVAFNALHGPLGEDGTVQGLLRMLEIPFTGPDVISAAITMDKRLTKLALLSAGISTPRFFSIRSATWQDRPLDWEGILEREVPRVPFPWVLKPNRLGSSVGVAIFRDPDQLLRDASDLIESWPASSRSDDLLVEEAIRGRELTCGVLETAGDPVALPPIEIRPRGGGFFDYHSKYTPGATEEICPAPLSDVERSRAQEAAVRTHRLFECAPLSRTDMFLTPAGGIQVLEVNTLPGMTPTSLIPLSASKQGIELHELFESLMDHALGRSRRWRAESSEGGLQGSSARGGGRVERAL